MSTATGTATGACPNCNTQNTYQEINCNMCGERLPWAPRPAAPPPPPTSTPSGADDTVRLNNTPIADGWYYTASGHRKGPVSGEAMRELISKGTVKRDTLVWREGVTDWQAANLTSLKPLFVVLLSGPPPISGSAVNNNIVWLVAFAPIYTAFMMSSLALSSGESAVSFWWVAALVNSVLCIADTAYLKSAGQDTEGMGVWAFFLVPVYLFMRAARLEQIGGYAWTWVACFIFSLFL